MCQLFPQLYQTNKAAHNRVQMMWICLCTCRNRCTTRSLISCIIVTDPEGNTQCSEPSSRSHTWNNVHVTCNLGKWHNSNEGSSCNPLEKSVLHCVSSVQYEANNKGDAWAPSKLGSNVFQLQAMISQLLFITVNRSKYRWSSDQTRFTLFMFDVFDHFDTLCHKKCVSGIMCLFGLVMTAERKLHNRKHITRMMESTSQVTL